MSQWLQSAKATVSAGASVISFTDNQDFSSVRAGDVVMVNGQIWQCVSGTRPDSVGKSTVTLAAPWPYTGASNVNAFVFRTTHDLLQLTSDARKLTNITKALLAAQEDILKGTTPTINVPIGLDPATGNEEVIQVTPWQYVINVVNASLGNISAIGAMSQVQFEAIREQNKDKYAASGWVSLGNHEAGKQVNECKPGLYTALTTPNTLLIGKAGGVGGSKTDHGVLCIAGVIFHLPLAYPIRLAQAPDGKTTYNKSTGVITNHATVAAAFNAQAADPVNVEVVINRVDMWGFEAFPQEVTPANPEIYPQGVFSDLFTSMNGIPTSDSARPVSYFGFLGKKAKKVDFFALSDAQKKKLLADPKNNLYYSDDGRLIQWVLRGRAFAGAGNGDWGSVDSTKANQFGFTEYLAHTTKTYIKPQGALYFSPPTSGSYPVFAGHNGHERVEGKSNVGCFLSLKSPVTTDEDIAVNGECYFLVCGTVNRLNQGAYHLSFNPSGSGRGVNSTETGWVRWWHTDAKQITNISACFIPYSSGGVADGSGFVGSIAGVAGGIELSGRPDGRVYDAIYADGQGGVCRDMRYSAYGIDSVDYAEADPRVKNGTYRGFEKLIRTKVIQLVVTEVGSYIGGHYIRSNVGDFTLLADKQYSLFYNKTKNIIGYTPVVEIANLYLSTNPICKGLPNIAAAASGMTVDPYTGTQVGDEVYLIAGLPMTNSVGGSFLQTDVIGNPENILATPALANGWLGSWGELAENGGVSKTGARKNINGGELTYTLNNGATWGKGTFTPNSENNVTSTYSDSDIRICQYQAFAKQTENAVNAEVYGGVNGIGHVFASANYKVFNGALLFESLTGRVLTLSAGAEENYTTPVQGLRFYLDIGRIADNSTVPHNQLLIQNGVANSFAFKALNYNVNINQQAFIQYAYTELKHNGTNWGDDDKVNIVDNQSTKTDFNSNIVQVGTAKLKEAIGWIKNKV